MQRATCPTRPSRPATLRLWAALVITMGLCLSLGTTGCDDSETLRPERTEDLVKFQTALAAFQQVQVDPANPDVRSFGTTLQVAEAGLGHLQDESMRRLSAEKEKVVAQLAGAVGAYRGALVLAGSKRKMPLVVADGSPGGHGPWRAAGGGALPKDVAAAIQQDGLESLVQRDGNTLKLELEAAFQELLRRARGRVVEADNEMVQIKTRYRL